MLQTKRVSPKSIFLSLLFSLCMGLLACQPTSQNSTESTIASSQKLPGTDTTIRAGISTTTDEIFITEIVNIGLEKLGYKTQVTSQLSPQIIHTAISNEELDFYATHFEKMQTAFFEKSGGDQKLERVGVIMKNILQGYQIDKKTADQYNITTIDQLKKPEIAKLFDSDGDGKANLTGCNVGWGCALLIEQHLNTHKLQDTVEHDQGRYDILLADIITRHQQGEPILYYAFVPHWSGSILKVNQDVIWLGIPNTALLEAQKNITEEKISIEEQNLGLTVDQVRIVANKKFLEANPTAKRLFEQITIPIEDINIELERAHNGEDRPEDIRRRAKEWVQENQQQFNLWVETAKQAIP